MLRRLIALLLHLPAVATGTLRLQRAAGRSAPRAGRLLLYFSEVMWDEVWQRPQELARRLARQVPTLYISPVQLHRWLFSLRGRWQPLRVIADGDVRLTVLSPLILPGHYRSRLVYRLNCWILAHLLRRWTADAQLIHCITDSPFAWPVLNVLFFRGSHRDTRLARLHYDIIDDFPSFGWAPGWARACEDALIEHADSVTTGTYELWIQHRPRRADAEFIQCGVDFDAFNRPADAIPDDLAACPEPRLGYAGSVSDRLDYDLLAELADRFPQGSVVLVGPVRMNEALLPRRPNIFYLGLRPHDDLPRYVQHFTVGLIPFLVNDATSKLNPVKTLEYLAAGIPVVSTAIPDVARFFSHAVYVAPDRAAFLDMVAEAATNPDIERIRSGVDLARTSSWDQMAHRMASRVLTAAPHSSTVSASTTGGRA